MSTISKELFVVTGGSRGIGLAIAQAAAKTGLYSVVIISQQSRPQAGLVGTLLTHDLATAEGVEAAGAAVLALKAPVACLVNNAGAFLDAAPLPAISQATLQASMQLHCFSPLLLANRLQPQMAQASNPAVVNIGSVYGNMVDTDGTAYGLSKTTIPLLTSMMAKAYAPKVRVNCVLPGHIDTDMTKAAPPEFIRPIIERTPLRRLGTVDEIANVVLFLASDRAAFLSGASLRADGGFWSTAP